MAVLYTTTEENEAWLVDKDNDISVDGFTLTRMWPQIDATVADTLCASLDAILTYTDPQADQQTYSGTFVNSKVRANEAGGVSDDNNQRYVNIIQTLIKVATVTGISDLSSTPIVVQENQILDLFAFEQGELDTLVYRWPNLNPSDASRKACFDISDASLEGRANVATNTPSSGWEYEDRRFVENENGTGELVVLYKQSAWSNVTNGGTVNATIAREKELALTNRDPENDVDGIRSTRTAVSSGIPIDDLVTVKGNQIASSGHAITSVSIRDNKDGSGTLSKSETKKRAIDNGQSPPGQESNLFTFETDYAPAFGNQQQTLVNRWFDLSETDSDKLKSDAISNQGNLFGANYAPTAVGYQLSRIRKIPTAGIDSAGDQLFDVVRTAFIPRNGSSGFWGSDEGHVIFVYTRKKDKIAVGIEHLRTNDIDDAKNFAKGDTVDGHSLAGVKTVVNDTLDPGTWVGDPIVVGFDAGNQTGVWRRGQDMYFAARVVFDEDNLPV